MTQAEQDQVDMLGRGVRAFLAQMRREHIKRHGVEAEVRVPIFEELSPPDRVLLLRSMRAALNAAAQAPVET